MNYSGKFDATLSPDASGTKPVYFHVDSAHVHAPADAIIVPDAQFLFNADFKRSGADLILTTYGTLRREAARLKDFEFDYVVLDEAQAVKNAQTEAAKAVRLLRGAPSVDSGAGGSGNVFAVFDLTRQSGPCSY